MYGASRLISRFLTRSIARSARTWAGACIGTCTWHKVQGHARGHGMGYMTHEGMHGVGVWVAAHVLHVVWRCCGVWHVCCVHIFVCDAFLSFAISSWCTLSLSCFIIILHSLTTLLVCTRMMYTACWHAHASMRPHSSRAHETHPMHLAQCVPHAAFPVPCTMQGTA